ncbi:nicotinate phosphoribosyltransferase [Spongorhabdus nitratireducens]
MTVHLGNRERIAAFDVDAQKGFTPLCPDELPVPDGHTIVAELNAQAELARWRVGSKDAHPEVAVWRATEEAPQLTPLEGEHVDVRWNMHCVPGTAGFELLDGLPAAIGYDYFVWKGVEPDVHPYGACFHDPAETRTTGVIEFLRSNRVETVLVGGLALEYCVKTTALQLLNAGFRVIVNLGATRGLAEDSTAAALSEMKQAGVEFIESAFPLQKKQIRFAENKPMIPSLLDTDFYKFSMQQAMFHRYRDVHVKAEFRCRTPHDLRIIQNELQAQIEMLGELRFSSGEIDYLRSLGHFREDYLSYLADFRLDPRAVVIDEEAGRMTLVVEGLWSDVTHFEIYLLALISELYSRYDEHHQLAEGRARLQDKVEWLQRQLATPGMEGFQFADFGTRRRAGLDWHREVMETLQQCSETALVGTSNVMFAREMGLKPVGTMAHEWVQGHQALTHDLRSSQRVALNVWLEEYGGDLGIALTDTIGLDAFLQDFDINLANRYSGVRHDSGDPIFWGQRVLEHYRKLDIDPREKSLVFSDGLNFDKAAELYRCFHQDTRLMFGIGTWITNDFGLRPPNIVIKIVEVNGQPVAKLSDAPGKTLCRSESYVAHLKEVFKVA